MTQHYVYLFHTKKFVDSKEPVYKIGKTTQPNFERFNQYDEGALFHFQISCRNCHVLERKMISLFKKKYELHCGLEYFKGNRFEMIKDICRFILEEDDPEIFYEEVVQYWFEDVVVNGNIASLNNNEVVMNDEENNKIDEKKVEMVVAITPTIHFCTPCGYPARTKHNFTKHCSTKKHKEQINAIPIVVKECEFKCPNCVKTYQTYQGLWGHNKKCKPVVVAIMPESVLLEKVDNLNVIIQELSKILHINDGDITEKNTDDIIVSNMNEVDGGDEVVLLDCNKKSFICVPCGYSSCRKSNFKKHCSTITHKEQLNPVAVIEGFHKCKNCDMTYKSYQGLWCHNKKCKPAVVAEVPEIDLHAKIDNLEKAIIDMTNQQLVINNKVIQQCL